MSFIDRKKAVVHKHLAHLIGRRAEISAVKYAIKQMEGRLTKQQKVKDYANVFYFYGPSGVGKSAVMQAIYQDCERGEVGYNPLTVWLDFRQLPIPKATARENLIMGLAQAMIELTEELTPYFKPLFLRWQQFCKEESSPLASSAPAAPAAPRPRANAVQSAYGSMSQLQSGKNQSVQSIARSVTKNMQAQAATQKGLKVPSPRQEIVNELTQIFAGIIDKISSSCPVVFFLDHYENFEFHESWLREQFMTAFQREVIFVIAGKDNYHQLFQYSFGNVANCMRLRPFSLFESEIYFKHFNRLQNPQIIQAAQDLTGGIAISQAMISAALQHLIARSQPSQILEFLAYPNQDYGDQLDKYIAYICLDEVPNSDKNMLATLAMMRSFDPDLFKHLSGVMNVRSTLEHFSQRYPFISATGQMSEFTARTIRGYFKQEYETIYRDVNQGAYAYYLDLNRQNPDDLHYLYESMYFYFHVDPRNAYKHLTQLISHFLHKDLDICDEICLAALDAAIPKTWKDQIQKIAESLGAFRKHDQQGAQAVLAAISGDGPPAPAQDEQFYLNYIEAMS